MIPSPLRLEWYFIKELHVTWQSEFDISQARPLSVSDLSVEVLPSPNDEEPLRWGFELVITLDDKTGKLFPYTFQIAMVGFFEVTKAYAERNPSRVEMLATVNGPAVLYSAAREHITTVTSRGPHPEVILPTVTFLPVEEKSETPSQPEESQAQVQVESETKLPKRRSAQKRKKSNR
jgi:preprotein translocase subunit SecB